MRRDADSPAVGTVEGRGSVRAPAAVRTVDPDIELLVSRVDDIWKCDRLFCGEPNIQFDGLKRPTFFVACAHSETQHFHGTTRGVERVVTGWAEGTATSPVATAWRNEA